MGPLRGRAHKKPRGEIQPLPHAPLLLRQGSEAVHVQRGRPDAARQIGPATEVQRQACEPGRQTAGRRLDLLAGVRDVQGACRLASVPDARGAARAHHPGVLEAGGPRARPVRGKRDDARGGGAAGSAVGGRGTLKGVRRTGAEADRGGGTAEDAEKKEESANNLTGLSQVFEGIAGG